MKPDQIRSLNFKLEGDKILVCWGGPSCLHPDPDLCVFEELSPTQIDSLLFELQAAYCTLYTDVQGAIFDLEQSAEPFDRACNDLREAAKRGSE
jgi:hypothetical protein